MECQYCKKVLTTKNSLSLHQKRAKYCLKIQEQKNNNIHSDLIECEFCKKQQSKHNFDRHKSTCKMALIIKNKDKDEQIILLKEEITERDKSIIEKDKEIESLKAQLQIYKSLSNDSQQCIKEIAKQPKTTNNTNTNNILNLAPLDMDILTERLTDVINSKMTESHVLDGQEGMARLVSCCFKTEDGKNLIACTDSSRGVWKSKDVNGNIIKDYKAGNIAKVIKPIAIKKADKIIEIDEIKRNKIAEISKIRRRRAKNIKDDEFDCSSQKGYRKGTIDYNLIEDRMRKRVEKQREDDKTEKDLLDEFAENNELYLLDLPDDDDKPYKMSLGKQDIVEMADDSSKFSSKLVTLV